MVKGVIFDMDGVLVDADDIHYNALNKTFESFGFKTLGRMEHDLIYRGLPTRRKLEMYMERYNVDLPIEDMNAQKQVFTMRELDTIEVSQVLIDLFANLENNGYYIAVASNAVRATVEGVIERLGLTEFIHMVISNEDVVKAKPHPEIYNSVFAYWSLQPEEFLIVEDSIPGIQAARASGAHVMEVSGVDEVNLFSVSRHVRLADTPIIVVPAAGQGKRFVEQGYLYPKPLILAKDGTLLSLVMSNIDISAEVHVLMQAEHIRQYLPCENLDGFDLHPVDGVTEGAACTVMLLRDIIDSPRELILMNSDQYLEDVSLREFWIWMNVRKADAGMITFEDDDEKWSYAETKGDDVVLQVREKQVLPGNNATVGIYYYRRGDLFCKAVDQMIAKDIRHKGEFYVAPAFNELVDDHTVIIWPIEKKQMWGLGTPEDLEVFNDSH